MYTVRMASGKMQGHGAAKTVPGNMRAADSEVLHQAGQILRQICRAIAGMGHVALTVPAQVINTNAEVADEERQNRKIPESKVAQEPMNQNKIFSVPELLVMDHSSIDSCFGHVL